MFYQKIVEKENCYADLQQKMEYHLEELNPNLIRKRLRLVEFIEDESYQSVLEVKNMKD